VSDDYGLSGLRAWQQDVQSLLETLDKRMNEAARTIIQIENHIKNHDMAHRGETTRIEGRVANLEKDLRLRSWVSFGHVRGATDEGMEGGPIHGASRTAEAGPVVEVDRETELEAARHRQKEFIGQTLSRVADEAVSRENELLAQIQRMGNELQRHGERMAAMHEDLVGCALDRDQARRERDEMRQKLDKANEQSDRIAAQRDERDATLSRVLAGLGRTRDECYLPVTSGREP